MHYQTSLFSTRVKPSEYRLPSAHHETYFRLFSSIIQIPYSVQFTTLSGCILPVMEDTFKVEVY